MINFHTMDKKFLEWEKVLLNIKNLIDILEKINIDFYKKIYNIIIKKKNIIKKIYNISWKISKKIAYFQDKIYSFRYKETDIKQLKKFEYQLLRYMYKISNIIFKYDIKKKNIYNYNIFNIKETILKKILKTLEKYKIYNVNIINDQIMINAQNPYFNKKDKKKHLKKILKSYKKTTENIYKLIIQVLNYQNIDLDDISYITQLDDNINKYIKSLGIVV